LNEPEIARPERVRVAGEADEDAIYDLLLALEDDNGFGVPHDRETVYTEIRKGTRKRGSMIGVIDGADELAASICITLGHTWFSNRWHLTETWLFIRPDYRFNRFDDDLFNFARWARYEIGKGLDYECQCFTTVSSPRRLPAKLRLWRRWGKQIGGIFLLD